MAAILPALGLYREVMQAGDAEEAMSVFTFSLSNR